MNALPARRTPVLWGQVAGLAALQGAIVLLWVIYGLYLPQLLAQFGFSKAWAVGLLAVESAMAIVLEPLAGSLSDELRDQFGRHFLMITIGGLLSATLFVAIPTIVVFGSPQSLWRWLVLGLLIAWAMAMAVFRSPALGLLGHYATATRLPQAASVLMLTSAIASSTNTFAQQFLLSLGPVVAFGVGSMLLLIATGLLRSIQPPASVAPLQPQGEMLSLLNLGWILVTGASVGVGTALLRTNLTALPAIAALPVFSVVHIATVLPAGLVAVRLGNAMAMISGSGLLAIGLLLLNFTPLPTLSVLLGAAFSLLINGSLPFVFSLVPAHRAGLGVGMYFGGSALASAILGAISAQTGPPSSAIAASVGSLAFAIAGACVATAYRPTAHRPRAG